MVSSTGCATTGDGGDYRGATVAVDRSAATASSRPTTLSSPTALTGFGALLDDWKAAHLEIPQYDGSAYDEDPTLDPTTDQVLGIYVGVQPNSEGRVVDYQVNLHRPVDESGARAAAAAELPPDAVLDWERHPDGCYQFQFSSPTLAQVPGVPAGQVFVEAEFDLTPPFLLLMPFGYDDPAEGPAC